MESGRRECWVIVMWIHNVLVDALGSLEAGETRAVLLGLQSDSNMANFLYDPGIYCLTRALQMLILQCICFEIYWTHVQGRHDIYR